MVTLWNNNVYYLFNDNKFGIDDQDEMRLRSLVSSLFRWVISWH